jgi:hypothetical protein
MPLLNRYGLTGELIARGHEVGGLTLSAPLRDEQSIEEEARRFTGEDGAPRTDRVLDVVSSAIAVSHRADLPHVIQSLREAGGAEGLRLATRPFDLFNTPTAEGFSFVRLLQRHAATGHIGELQLHTIDLLQARDLGIGSHPSVQNYSRRLLQLPGDTGQRTAAQQEEWDLIWGQVRHAIYLALTAEMSRPTHLETDEDTWLQAQRRLHHVRLRTACAGTLRDAEGKKVQADLEGTRPEDYEALRWPRTYVSAEGTPLGQDVADTPILNLETAVEPVNWHPADVLWCALTDKKAALRLRENAARVRDGLAPFQRARLWLNDHHYLEGVIENAIFHPRDSVDNGISWFELTYSPPPYREISLREIEAHDEKLEYLPE